VKADTIDEERQNRIREAEEQKKRDQKTLNENRRTEFEEKKKEYMQIRRQEKLKKRAVNIEIGSEILDLIMDVANVAWDHQLKGSKKIEKPQWREWMEVFKQNKNLSLMMSEGHTSPHQSLMEEDLLDQGEEKEFLSRQVQEILQTMKEDPAFMDMLSYLSVSQPFNLTSLPEWGDIGQFSSQFESVDFQFLNSFLPCQDSDLGRCFENMLYNMFKGDKSSSLNLSIARFKKEFLNIPLS